MIIKQELVKAWKYYDGLINFNQAVDIYCFLSFAKNGKYPYRPGACQNVYRILQENGFKSGKRGSRAAWVHDDKRGEYLDPRDFDIEHRYSGVDLFLDFDKVKFQLCKNCEHLIDMEPGGGFDHHVEEHPDICCDCFDESLGMPEEYRSRPRIKPW